ncbi:MAG: glycoside hydrolase family 3 N-terminal domain-containing protein, partial [Acidocella sp.]|nr:glycoside hydrolase family 3 N-terminal domain-containing protein [Acidocella sp.]
EDDDLLPFIANKALPWAMTAHVVYEEIDPVNPATLSATVIRDVIRGQIGFTGTLISDDLAMGALTGAPAVRALAALKAGCDVALYCPGDFAGNRAVLEVLV